MPACLIEDTDRPLARPFNRLFSIATLRDGMLNPLERWLLENKIKDADLFFSAEPPDFAHMLGSHMGWKTGPVNPEFTFTYDFNPAQLLGSIGDRLEKDLAVSSSFSQRLSGAPGKFPSSHWIGSDFYIHNSAEIMPGNVLDARNGPIIIDQGAIISPFSYLEGPLYIGKDALIDNARITGGSVLGQAVRAGGEIENSIMGDFSNKHHEGFLGHSITGRWVNLGALTTTSDLKNNYGEVRFRLPGASGETRIISSGVIKFGSLIGDCVKTAIGTCINAGSIIEAGSCIFGGQPACYVPALTWGQSGRYQPQKFYGDCQRIFARRKIEARPQLLALAEWLASQRSASGM